MLFNYNDSSNFKKQEEIFNTSIRTSKDKSFKPGSPSLKSIKSITKSNNYITPSMSLFTEDTFNNTLLLSPKNFNFFSNEVSLDSTEESYENTKYLNYIYFLNYKNILNFNLYGVHPVSYTTILDAFRPDYGDQYIALDNINENTTYNYSLNVDTILHNEFRLSNLTKLRSSAKNAIVTYNAIQKVFRSRFDEARSNTDLRNFSNSYVKHPFITSPKSPYESILGKNKENFFDVTFYNQTLKDNFSTLHSLFNSNNTYFYEIPFLVSMKSDPSRYLWFD
jgi:hypothetical protein